MVPVVGEDTFAAAQAAKAHHSAFSPRRSTPRAVAAVTPGDLRRLRIHTRAQQMTSSTGKIGRYDSCAYHDPVLAGGPDKAGRQRRIRADELDNFVYDKVHEVLLRPESCSPARPL